MASPRRARRGGLRDTGGKTYSAARQVAFGKKVSDDVHKIRHTICDDPTQYHVDRLQRELEQCWQDNREAKNRILQASAAAVAVLAIVYALVVGLDSGKGSHFDNDATLFVCMALTVSAEIACISYAMATTVLSFARYAYMRELEHELGAFDLYSGAGGRMALGWLETRGVLATPNPQHVYHRYAALHFVGSFGAVLGVVAACFCFLFLFGTTVGTDPSTQASFILLGVIAVVPFAAFAVYAIYQVVFRSDDVLSKAREIARESRLVAECSSDNPIDVASIQEKRRQGKANVQWFIRYALFPRLQDEPKGLFMVAGFIIAYGVLSAIDGGVSDLGKMAGGLAYAWFVLDYLVFQARYQLNDIRGRKEDQENPAFQARHRLRSMFGNQDTPAFLSLLIVLYRLLIAAVCIGADYFNMGGVLAISTTCIAILAVIYEILRSWEGTELRLWRDAHAQRREDEGRPWRSVFRPIAMRMVMSTGYAARFLYGVLCCFAMAGVIGAPGCTLWKDFAAVGYLAWWLAPVLASIVLYGLATSSILWALEGAAVLQGGRERTYPKMHVVVIASKLAGFVWDPRPVFRARSVKYPWVPLTFVVTVLLDVFALCRLSSADYVVFRKALAIAMLFLGWFVTLVVEGSRSSCLRFGRLALQVLVLALLARIADAFFSKGTLVWSPCVFVGFAAFVVLAGMLIAYQFLTCSDYQRVNQFPVFQVIQAWENLRALGRRFLATGYVSEKRSSSQ